MFISLLEFLLAPVLIILAWQILHVTDLFKAIVLFMVFGIFMAIAWAGMNAPDIALVEAAIGSGLAGALFLGYLARMESGPDLSNRDVGQDMSNASKWNLGVLLISAVFILVGVELSLPVETSGLGGEVSAFISRTGVANPVTAVILDFRAFDTLLEIGVLLLAVVAVHALGAQDAGVKRFRIHPASRVLLKFLQVLVPFMVLVSGYLLWAGGDYPGGAFQAGAILAAAGILMLIGGVSLNLAWDQFWVRFVLAIGFLGFLLIGAMVMVGGRHFLEFPWTVAKYYILGIESLAMVSIALILLSLFAGCVGALDSRGSK